MSTCPYPGHTACQLRDDLERVRQCIAAVRELHVAVAGLSVTQSTDPRRLTMCRHCHYAWPCPTVAALDGAS